MELVLLVGLGLLFKSVAMEDLKDDVRRNSDSLEVLTKRLDRMTLDYNSMNDLKLDVRRNSDSLKVLTKRLDRMTVDFYSIESKLDVKIQTLFDEWKSAINSRDNPPMNTHRELELTQNVKNVIEESVQKQSAIVYRTLSVEKYQMRKLKSDIQSDMIRLGTKTDDQFKVMQDSLNRSVQKYERETDEHRREINSEIDAIKGNIQDHNDTLQSVRETLGSNANRISSIASRISSNSNSISSISSRISTNANSISSFSSQISQLSNKVSSNTNSISSQSSSISNLYKKRGDFSAFSAELTNKLPNYPKSKTIVFGRVYTNRGYDYSSSTGIYTAPVSGYYLFLFNIQCNKSKLAYVILNENGSTYFEAVAQSIDVPNVTGGNSGILHLNKGDRVWIGTASWESTYDIIPWRTTFSGTLLYAD